MEAAAVIEILQSAVPGAAYEVGHNVDMRDLGPVRFLPIVAGVAQNL